MLAFGRGIFTAVVISTFFLLLFSFYPSEIQGELYRSPIIQPTMVSEARGGTEIEADRIIKLCTSSNISLPIKKIVVDADHTLDIHYGIDAHSKDYGFVNSYKLANLLFAEYDQIDTIRYTVLLQNKPYFQAEILRDNHRVIETSAIFDSKKILTEIQRTFTITLLGN